MPEEGTASKKPAPMPGSFRGMLIISCTATALSGVSVFSGEDPVEISDSST